MTTKHTPLPWEIEDGIMFESMVVGPQEGPKRDILFQGDLANARFICRAVNSHDELVDALKSCDSNMRILAKASGQYVPGSIYVDCHRNVQAILAKLAKEEA